MSRASQDLRYRVTELSARQRKLLAHRLRALRHEDATNPQVDAHENSQLVAYAVPAPGKEPDGDDLRRYLAERLPSFMVPAQFVLVPDLPRTQNGKVDRPALASRGFATHTTTDAASPPQTNIERILTGIWSDVLKQDSVGIDDNFFELGGDSLLSIRILAKMREAGWSLTPEDFVRNQTIRAQAAVASPALSASEDRSELPNGMAESQPFDLAGLDADEMSQVSRMLDETDSTKHDR